MSLAAYFHVDLSYAYCKFTQVSNVTDVSGSQRCVTRTLLARHAWFYFRKLRLSELEHR